MVGGIDATDVNRDGINQIKKKTSPSVTETGASVCVPDNELIKSKR